jgi:hypothetical protein
MRKLIFLTALAVFAFSLAGSSFAYVIDGNLNDWGVTPFSDWLPNNPGAEFTQENNWNRAPSDPFNESYDLEAFYFDDDVDYLYFGIVTSNPYTSNWASEDMAIDLNGDGDYEFGLDVANLPTNALSTKGVYSVNSWADIRGVPYQITGGTQLGTYEIYSRHTPPNPWWHAIIYGAAAHTYVLEGRVDRSLFGNIAAGTTAELLFSRVTCLKDWITVNGVFNYSSTGPTPPTPGPTPIPEPSTMLLLGGGLLGLGRMIRRKRRIA